MLIESICNLAFSWWLLGYCTVFISIFNFVRLEFQQEFENPFWQRFLWVQVWESKLIFVKGCGKCTNWMRRIQRFLQEFCKNLNGFSQLLTKFYLWFFLFVFVCFFFGGFIRCCGCMIFRKQSKSSKKS